MTIFFSERVQRIKPSPTLAMAARAETMKAAGLPIINLSIGEPDFDTPAFIKEAAIRALQEGHTKYTAVDGIPRLREAISHKFKNENKLTYDSQQILVSCGAKHSLYNILAATLNTQDEVIIPAPYWVSYPDMVKLCDGTPIFIPTDATQHFKINAEQLEAAITPRTRMVMLNSPSNPSGMAYSFEEWKNLSEALLKHPNILIVSDDIYEHTLWNHVPFSNILNACPELYDRTLIVNGVSKSYAMTGFRIGYTAGPAKLIAAMKKIQSQITSNPTSISQYAALAALTGDQSCIAIMRKAYKERHDFVYRSLTSLTGFKTLPSDGTFYIFPSVECLVGEEKPFPDDLVFSEFLLNKAHIAVVPGSAFGTPGYIRMSYATSLEELSSAMENLKISIDAALFSD